MPAWPPSGLGHRAQIFQQRLSGKFRTTISARARMKRRNALRCSLSLRSTATERLLRLIATNIAATPSTNGGPHERASSPPAGFSILKTSRRSSVKICAAVGAAMLVPSSTTTSSESGNDPVGWSCGMRLGISFGT